MAGVSCSPHYGAALTHRWAPSCPESQAPQGEGEAGARWAQGVTAASTLGQVLGFGPSCWGDRRSQCL